MLGAPPPNKFGGVGRLPSGRSLHPMPVISISAQTCFREVGAGFDRLPNSRFETLRFPRVVKVHHDRGFLDAIDFGSYQEMTRLHHAGNENETEVVRDCWLEKLGLETSVNGSALQTSPPSSRVPLGFG
jgi:hypothetical protein